MKTVSLLFHDVYASDPGESGFRSHAADRYKLSIPAFEAQLDCLFNSGVDAPLVADALATPAYGDTRSSDPGGRTPSLITFDDGGESYFTVAADRLEDLGWRGHCFVTTGCIGQRGFLTVEQIRELDARGHVIGTHSTTHPSPFSALTPAEMRREWSESRDVLEDVLGHAVTVASVPGGYFSAAVANAAAAAGLRLLFTSEPTTRVSSHQGCLLVGRFTIRRGHAADMASRFVLPAPWARFGAWANWNAKAMVKPLLGPSYSRIADWLLANRASTNHG